MRRFLPALLVVAAGCPGSSQTTVTNTDDPFAPSEARPTAGTARLAYPAAARGDTVDDYHGTKVADPYRWLEDTDAPDARAWIEAQNALTFGFLDKIPARAAITERLTRLWNYEKYSLPAEKGGRFFFSRNDGLQNQGVLYWAASLDGEPQVLLDPNALAADGTVALAGTSVSDDGKYLAYGLQRAGSDWADWHVREVATGTDTSDLIKWSKFGGASWTRDGKGFYYSRFPETKDGESLLAVNINQSLWYHRLGTPQSADQLIYERPDQPKWYMGGGVTEDGRYYVISESQGTGPHNTLYYQDLKGTTPARRRAKPVAVIKDFEAEYTAIGNDGPVFYLKTDLDAPRGRIIAIDLRKPAKAHWKELVAQAKEPIAAASLVGDQLFVEYMVDAKSAVKAFDLTGKLIRDVALPGMGSVAGFDGRRDHTQAFYSYTSFTEPGAVFRYDLASGKSEVWRRPQVDFDGSAYETTQAFFASKDGTKVPMFITHKKGLVLDGNNPTLLYGYGGFSISLSPFFSPTNSVWLERGGVLAVANLRGGGEYGEEWHVAGTKANKQNVFDDFIAAAEWLIANQYTRPAKLAIQGGSNGGLLVGACMVQRPELFGAALPSVGVMDMLRFHKFTIGWGWVDDYGSSDDAAELKVLLAYSPLHNVKPDVAYPATLVTTGDHDDRVVPGHSFKFTAELQRAHKGDHPILIRIETKGGHGAGKPTAMKIAESADQLAFMTAVFERADGER